MGIEIQWDSPSWTAIHNKRVCGVQASLGVIVWSNRDITFVTKDGVSKGFVNILGKVTTLTHKTVQTLEDTVEVEQPAELLEKALDRKTVYWKALPAAARPLPAGYCHQGREQSRPCWHLWRAAWMCRPINDEKLATSSLILADEMNAGLFARYRQRQLRDWQYLHICPRVSANPATPVSYKRNQQLNFWMQVYNLGIDEPPRATPATVTYQIVDTATNTVMLEKAAGIERPGGAQRPVDGGENAAHRRPCSRASTR